MQNQRTILSPEEIEEITGYEQPKRQALWFRAHGTRAEINAKNCCIVRISDWLGRAPETQTQRAPLVLRGTR
ncbi:hypothetical protein AAKU67_002245 [Oxalobacteraceae bacterium GrIS 2.11]